MCLLILIGYVRVGCVWVGVGEFYSILVLTQTLIFQILEAADTIHKLSSIASELSPLKFEHLQARIQYKYDQIEKLMLDEFQVCMCFHIFFKYTHYLQLTHRMGNKQRLRQIAVILSNFRAYPQCIDAFVENVQVVRCCFCI
jgi:hypothetical protein